MVDANQRWSVDEAVDWMISLAKYNLKWIEEPTSPDDILGHANISRVANYDCCSSRGCDGQAVSTIRQYARFEFVWC